MPVFVPRCVGSTRGRRTTKQTAGALMPGTGAAGASQLEPWCRRTLGASSRLEVKRRNKNKVAGKQSRMFSKLIKRRL